MTCKNQPKGDQRHFSAYFRTRPPGPLRKSVTHDCPSRVPVLCVLILRYIPIDAFGKCYSRSCDDECMENNLKTHKFVVAMENSVCEDYVTEKFFRIKQLIVPIVLRQKDYLHIAPNGSYIAVDQFR